MANAKGFERFAVLCYSDGGPYALSCALQIPGRLTAVDTVSSPAPYDVPGLTDAMNPNNLSFIELARERHRVSRLTHALLMGIVSRLTPGSFVAQAKTSWPEPDRVALSRPEFRQALLGTLVEAQREGACGEQLDTALMASPWGFDPSEVRTKVRLWHGEADQNALAAMGRFLANAIPECEARFYRGEGHLSLFANYPEEMLGALIS